MTQNLRIAVCQFPVSADINENAKFIRRFMKKAAASEAHLVHFPETALPGYGRADFMPSNTDNWQLLKEETQAISALAGKLGLWVILGSCRSIAESENPTNCIHVISDKGEIAGTYDKQKLPESE